MKGSHNYIASTLQSMTKEILSHSRSFDERPVLIYTSILLEQYY